jgi:large subunit ribosomal protein L4
MSVNAATYTKSGTKATTPVKLNDEVFAQIPENMELIKLAYVAYLANGRVNLAVSKKRGEVSGGGKKPWKQKGTGRARAGSIRSPIWRGGGITFGPTGEENYTKSISTVAKRTALRQALSLAAKDGRIKVIESFDLKDNKTAEASKLLSKLDAQKGNVLLAVENVSVELTRAVRNITSVKLIQSTYANVYDVTNADHIVITKPALEALTAQLGGKK